MRIKLIFLMAMLITTLLCLSGIAVAGALNTDTPPAGENSVRITIGDAPTMTNVAEGDVVHRDERANPGDGSESFDCEIPGVRIQMSGDVRSVRVGLQNGTCNLVVQDLQMNYTTIPTSDEEGSASTAINAQAGWEWYVESLAKVVGVNSVDDLTKTYAHFNFKTAEITGGGPLFDGSDP